MCVFLLLIHDAVAAALAVAVAVEIPVIVVREVPVGVAMYGCSSLSSFPVSSPASPSSGVLFTLSDERSIRL